MSLSIGRKGFTGLGLQTGFQVPATIADYVEFTDNDIHGMVDQLVQDQATGLREKIKSTVTGKKWSEGTIELYADSKIAGYFMAGALGTTQSVNLAGSVYRHTITRNNSNTPQFLTLTNDRVVDQEIYADIAIDELELSTELEFAKISAKVFGNFPQTTTSGTKTTASGNLFSFKDSQFAFATTISGAQTATNLKPHDFKATIKNNTEVIHAHGSALPRSINHKEFEAEAEFTLYFENVTDRDAYYNQSKQAASYQMLGNGIGGGYQESLALNFYQTSVQSFALETGLANFYAEKVKLTAELDTASGRVVDCVITNTKSSY